jgi:hypothetical protein
VVKDRLTEGPQHSRFLFQRPGSTHNQCHEQTVMVGPLARRRTGNGQSRTSRTYAAMQNNDLARFYAVVVEHRQLDVHEHEIEAV